MFKPAVVELEAYKNGVLRTQFTIQKDGSAMDLTNWEIKMEVRQKPGDTVLAWASTEGGNPDGSIITLISPTGGVFEVFLSNVDFQDIPTPPNPRASDPQLFDYDILFTNPTNGDFMPFIKGFFKLYPGITEE